MQPNVRPTSPSCECEVQSLSDAPPGHHTAPLAMRWRPAADWSATTTMSSTTAMSSDVKSEKAERRSSSQRRQEPTSDVAELHRRLAEDPRFNPPTPSPWKRAALVVLVVVLFWLGITMRKQMAKQPEVIYATRSVLVHPIASLLQLTWLVLTFRYSKEHKFRPAASPVITERLPDGRLRVRGAAPTFR